MGIERPKAKPPIPENAKRVFKGEIFEAFQWDQKLYDGSTAVFEKLRRPDTVVVFPILPDGRIILVQEEQPGRDLFLGASGGRVETNESVIDAAKRELLEETGYKTESLVLWKAEQPVNKLDWAVYYFIAKDVKKVSDSNLDAGEKITLKTVSFEEFIGLIVSGEFSEKGITAEIFQAKLYPEKMKELKSIFNQEI